MPRSDEIIDALHSHLAMGDYVITNVIIEQESVDEDAETAYQYCKVISNNADCRKTEDVEIYYYCDEDKWQIGNANVHDLATYELLSDLSQSQCRSLLSGRVPVNAEITELSTDRYNMTAKATISYQKSSNAFGTYGSVTKNVVAKAIFHWKPNEWELTNYEENAEHIYDVQCHVEKADSISELPTQTFNLAFDLSCEKNNVSITNIEYSANVYLAGKLQISNPRIGEESSESKMVICFDYERDANALSESVKKQHGNKLKSTSGTGQLILFSESAGNSAGFTRLEFENWNPTASGAAWRNQGFWAERS